MQATQRPRAAVRSIALAAALALGAGACGDSASPLAPAASAVETPGRAAGASLPGWAALRAALQTARAEANGGFNLDMWATVVDRTGQVVAVVHTGAAIDDQWPGSRVISAQKANTANAFSLRGLALSTANLYTAVQPGGTLFGLQESNPVDPRVAYAGNPVNYGTARDPMVGERIGGINVFGGGLALYGSAGELLGAVGVSGDASCADHNIAWKVRDALALDFVPGGVSPTRDDNIIYDITAGTQKSASGFGHPECAAAATAISEALPTSHPISRR